MSLEATEFSAEADGPIRRLFMIFAGAFWATSAVCVVFTMCYAYHIGI